MVLAGLVEAAALPALQRADWQRCRKPTQVVQYQVGTEGKGQRGLGTVPDSWSKSSGWERRKRAVTE